MYIRHRVPHLGFATPVGTAFKLQPFQSLCLSQAVVSPLQPPLHFPTLHLHALPIHQATSPFKCELTLNPTTSSKEPPLIK